MTTPSDATAQRDETSRERKESKHRDHRDEIAHDFSEAMSAAMLKVPQMAATAI
jgi:hypothetical protein